MRSMVEGQRRIRGKDLNSGWGRSRLRSPSTALGGPPCILDLMQSVVADGSLAEPSATSGSPFPHWLEPAGELGAPVTSSKPERLRGFDPAQQGRG